MREERVPSLTRTGTRPARPRHAIDTGSPGLFRVTHEPDWAAFPMPVQEPAQARFESRDRHSPTSSKPALAESPAVQLVLDIRTGKLGVVLGVVVIERCQRTVDRVGVGSRRPATTG